MKKTSFCGCILLFLSITTTSYLQDANSIIRKVKEKLSQVKDYQAEGTMKLNVSFLQVPDSKVKVYYKQPDKFRIKQDKGISLVPKGGISINLNSLLSGDQYTAVDAGNSTINKQSVKVIKMLPLNEEEEVVLSTLYIDPNTFLVKKITTNTKDNGSYTIEFTYGKYSSYALPDELIFSFNTKDYKLPKGMTFDYEEEVKRDTTHLKNTRGEVRISFNTYLINKGFSDDVFK